MADDNISTDVTEETGSATDTAGHEDDVTSTLSDAGKRALSEERKARAAAERTAKAAQKQLDEVAKRLTAFEDRDKTELQRATEAVAAAEKRAAEAEQKWLRQRVATDKKLPSALADRLRGSTEEEMSADADALLAGLPKPPTPSFDGGVRQTAKTTDMNTLIRRAAGLG